MELEQIIMWSTASLSLQSPLGCLVLIMLGYSWNRDKHRHHREGVKTAAGNRQSGKEVIQQLLSRGENIVITEEAVKAAAARK